MNETIKYIDFSIIYGKRSQALQKSLFEKGRIYRDNKWSIKNLNDVVTYCDGKIDISEHNYTPSRAIDIIPYPTRWVVKENFYFLAGYVLNINKELYDSHKVKHLLRWGGDWDSDMDFKDQSFIDLVHYEIIQESK